MPIKHKLNRTRPPNATELTRMLYDEWTHPKEKGQPEIVIEGKEGEPQHVYVIWDAWGELAQNERSEIIMDVIENLGDRFKDLTLVTVAMGLTTAEARRMGLEAA